MRNLRVVTLPFVLFTAIGLSACSGSQGDEEKLEATGEDAEAASGTEETAAAAEPAPAADVAAPAEPTPAPVAAPADVAVDKNRVVRFVAGDEVTIASEPKDGATVVGKLVKGDKVLVVEQGGWGKINDGMFVNLKHLSKKGVAPAREPAHWTAPAH